jgi:succinate dehydrogenase hydrophobic anchor subunit
MAWRDEALYETFPAESASEIHPRIGFWGWLGLYASGAVLLLLLVAHIWIVHFATTGPLSLGTTLETLNSPIIRGVELALLFLALVHSLLGVARVVLDLEVLKQRGRKVLIWGLSAAGAGLLAWGFVLFATLSSAGD